MLLQVSVKFDPISLLSLPLPVKKERRIDVFLVRSDVSRPPKQYKVTAPKSGHMGDLCKALSEMVSAADGEEPLDPKSLVVTDVYNHRFHKIYTSDEALSHILDRDDIFIYEVAKPADDDDDDDFAAVPVYMRERKNSSAFSPSNLFGQPMLLAVPKKSQIDYEGLYNLVLTRLSRIAQAPPPNSDVQWWKKAKRRGGGNNQQENAVNGVRGGGDGESGDSTPASEEAAPVAEDAADGNAVASPMVTDENTNGEVDNRRNDDDDDNDDDEEEEEDEEDEGRGPPKLFALNFVNSYGNAQLEPLSNDGRPVGVTGKKYLSLDWHPRAKEMFYDEKEAERFDTDAVSVNTTVHNLIC